MGELAELGRIAKAQQAADDEPGRSNKMGRYIAGVGGGTGLMGLGLTGHGFQQQLATSGRKGARRFGAGVVGTGLGASTLAAAPIVGGINMAREHRWRKWKKAQQERDR